MINKLTLSALLMLLLSACSQNPKSDDAQPDWVFSESSQYPRSKFIVGVGEADTMTDAKSRARAEIAKVFNVTVQASSSDVSTFQQSTGAPDDYSLGITRDIQTRTQQRLEGVKIAEVWQDKMQQRYYALAVLPRQVTAMNLRSEITLLDETTASLIERIQHSNSLVNKIRWSGEAIALQQKRSLLNKQLQVVSVVGQAIAPQWSIDKLQMDRAALVSRITVTAMATGKNEEALQTSLEDALANQGFTVVPAGEYVLKAHLDSTPLAPRGSWYYEKGSLNISLMGENKQSLGGYVWDFKVSSSDPTLTDLRVLEQAKKLLNTELNTKLFDLLEARE